MLRIKESQSRASRLTQLLVDDEIHDTNLRLYKSPLNWHHVRRCRAYISRSRTPSHQNLFIYLKKTCPTYIAQINFKISEETNGDWCARKYFSSSNILSDDNKIFIYLAAHLFNFYLCKILISIRFYIHIWIECVFILFSAVASIRWPAGQRLKSSCCLLNIHSYNWNVHMPTWTNLNSVVIKQIPKTIFIFTLVLYASKRAAYIFLHIFVKYNKNKYVNTHTHTYHM